MTNEELNEIYKDLFLTTYKDYKKGVEKSDLKLYRVLTKFPDVRKLLSKEESSDSIEVLININDKICNRLESKIKSQEADLKEYSKIVCSQNNEIIGLASKMQEMVQ
jgi:hypothetical protein